MFWDKYVKKWSMKKESKNESEKVMRAGEKVMRAGRFAAEAGASRGGGGFTSELC